MSPAPPGGPCRSSSCRATSTRSSPPSSSPDRSTSYRSRSHASSFSLGPGTRSGGTRSRGKVRGHLEVPMLAALALLLAGATVKSGPRHEEVKYAFGGHPPVLHLKPGTRLVSWTDDCFDGAV